MEYLESVGLKDFADSYPHELSGGMKQRVAIIRSLINDSKSLLMDESFSALDVQARHKLQKQVHKICKEQHKTILFVTHDIDEAVFLSEIFEVKLEHPRNREDKEFEGLVSKIIQAIDELEDG